MTLEPLLPGLIRTTRPGGAVQEYLAHKKAHPPGITIGPYALAYCRALGGGGSYERGTPVAARSLGGPPYERGTPVAARLLGDAPALVPAADTREASASSGEGVFLAFFFSSL